MRLSDAFLAFEPKKQKKSQKKPACGQCLSLVQLGAQCTVHNNNNNKKQRLDNDDDDDDDDDDAA